MKVNNEFITVKFYHSRSRCMGNVLGFVARVSYLFLLILIDDPDCGFLHTKLLTTLRCLRKFVLPLKCTAQLTYWQSDRKFIVWTFSVNIKEWCSGHWQFGKGQSCLLQLHLGYWCRTPNGFLGIMVNTILEWNDQVETITSKAAKTLFKNSNDHALPGSCVSFASANKNKNYYYYYYHHHHHHHHIINMQSTR